MNVEHIFTNSYLSAVRNTTLLLDLKINEIKMFAFFPSALSQTNRILQTRVNRNLSLINFHENTHQRKVESNFTEIKIGYIVLRLYKNQIMKPNAWNCIDRSSIRVTLFIALNYLEVFRESPCND